MREGVRNKRMPPVRVDRGPASIGLPAGAAGRLVGAVIKELAHNAFGVGQTVGVDGFFNALLREVVERVDVDVSFTIDRREADRTEVLLYSAVDDDGALGRTDEVVRLGPPVGNDSGGDEDRKQKKGNDDARDAPPARPPPIFDDELIEILLRLRFKVAVVWFGCLE